MSNTEVGIPGTETERKFLIAYPLKLLGTIPDTEKSEIVQTYLLSDSGVTSRVRKRVYSDCVKYIKTEKRRITNMRCFEDERELTESEYNAELLKADPHRKPVSKVRYLLRNSRHVFEIDIYPFWHDRAIMEIELSSENEVFEIPNGIKVLREVTDDKRYKNASLAKSVPFDEI